MLSIHETSISVAILSVLNRSINVVMLRLVEISTSVWMLSIPKTRMSTHDVLYINESSQSVAILNAQE